MIPGREFLLKALIAGSLFINGLAIGVIALYVATPTAVKDSTESEAAGDVKQAASAVNAGSAGTTAEGSSPAHDELANEMVAGTSSVDPKSPLLPARGRNDAEPKSSISSSGTQISVVENSNAGLLSINDAESNKFARILENADAISEGGDFQQSLKVYQRLRTLDEEYRRYEVAARVAFCHESLGQSKQALLVYQAIAEQSDNPRLVAACQIGFARTTLNRGESEIASRLLQKMFLNGDLFQMQDAFSAELMFLLAESELRRFEKLNRHEPGSLQRISSVGIDASAADSFRLLTGVDVQQSVSEEGTSGASLNRGSHIIEQVAYDAAASGEIVLVPSTESTLHVEINPQLKTAAITASGTTKMELLTALAESAGLSLSVSPAARDQLVTEFQDVSKKSVKIDMALDAILLSSGMLWTTQEQVLQISLVGENAAFHATSQLAALERTLRHCIIYFPGHSRATLAKVALANVTFWQGNPAVAIGHYGNLLRERKIKRLFPVIRFNMAVCCLQMEDLVQAEHHFQQVIDNSLTGSELGEAHIHKGVLEIESDRFKKAVKTFSRGVSTSVNPRAKSLACLGLAAAYIESENPYAAVKAIELGSSLFKGEHLDAAVFLVSLAKLHIKGRENSEPSRHLLSASSRFDPGSLPGLLGYKLLADAYGELNFQEARLVTLQRTLETNFASNLRRPLLLELANSYSDTGQQEQAALILQSVQRAPTSNGQSSADSSQVEVKPLIALANVYYHAENLNDALAVCRRAIQLDRDLEYKDELLGLLGKIYQAQGNNVSAAMCFAGLMPTFTDEVQSSVPVYEQ